METERIVALFRNGRNQAVRIPRDLELPGHEALIRKEGNRLIVEPVRADRYYAEIRAHLSRKGQPIGSNDLLIAAHALALDLTLVTANVDEFSRVPGLFIENWVVSQRP